MILITFLILISALAKYASDKIRFRPSEFPFQSDWWMARRRYAHDKRSKWTRGIVAMVNDGWHFSDFIRIVCFSIMAGLALHNVHDFNLGNDVVLWSIIVYVVHQTVFEIFY